MKFPFLLTCIAILSLVGCKSATAPVSSATQPSTQPVLMATTPAQVLSDVEVGEKIAFESVAVVHALGKLSDADYALAVTADAAFQKDDALLRQALAGQTLTIPQITDALSANLAVVQAARAKAVTPVPTP